MPMTFDLVAPERRLSSVAATAVRLPGSDGDMTVMEGHAPVITTLRPGLIRVEHAGGSDEFVVTGGFAEITGAAVTVLAERSMTRAEYTPEVHAGLLAEMREGLTPSGAIPNEAGPVDDAARLLADMVAVGTHIGIAQGAGAPAPG